MARKYDPYDDYTTPSSFLPEDSAVQNAALSPTAARAAQATEDAYYTKIVGLTGKTQAQLDALANARATAATIRNESPTMSARVDPLTGQIITTPKGTGITGGGAPGAGAGAGLGAGKVYTATDGTPFTDAQAYATYQASLNANATNKALMAQEAKAAEEKKLQDRQSAYDLLYQQFNQYGLGSLVEGIKGLIQSNVSPSEFAIRLQDTDAYKKRFAANQERIAQGLKALTPAEYIGLEDQYQNIMRNYGLPSSYYAKDSMGTQAGFNKFIANDVSAAELEDRVVAAKKRVMEANPQVQQALRQFYPDITDGDILSYALDPKKALSEIQRKVTAAEIGGAALAQGLTTNVGSAEGLAGYGITKAQAQQGYQQIGEFLPTAEKLGNIYQNPYDQAVAEAEVFGTAGAAQAAAKRKKLAGLETAAFSGSSGTTQGALERGRQGAF